MIMLRGCYFRIENIIQAKDLTPKVKLMVAQNSEHP